MLPDVMTTSGSLKRLPLRDEFRECGISRHR
jgi:hypothetical protein